MTAAARDGEERSGSLSAAIRRPAQRSGVSGRRAALARGLAVPVLLLGLAEVTARASNLQSDSLAPPSAVLAAFASALADGSILAATRDTLLAAFGGLAIGGGIGLLLGILLGLLPIADRLLEFTIEAIRPIPSVAVIPLALIALGFGYRMEIAIVSFACVWPVLVLTRAAIAGIDPRLLEVARALRLSPLQRIAKIVFPAALPRIVVGFRVAAGVALVVAVTVEIAANPMGLGHAIMTAQQALQPALMLAFLAWIGIVGFTLNAVLVWAQRALFGRATMVEAA